MTNTNCLVMLFASMLVTACGFQNQTTLKLPTAPSNTGSSSSSAPSSPNPSSLSGSRFAGTWASGTIAGLPDISTCGNLQWLITDQSPTAVAGSISATCAGSVNITATLAGQLESEDVMDLTANGQAVSSGVTCGLSLTGVARRESNDSVRLEYQGTTCLGPVSGTENLRRSFPL